MPHLIIRLSGSTLTSKLDSLGICPTHVSDLWRMCSSSWSGHNYSYSFCQRIEMTQRHHHCTNTEQLTIWWGLSNPFFHDHPAEKWLVYSKGLWFLRRTRLSERGLTRDWSVVVGPPGCALQLLIPCCYSNEKEKSISSIVAVKYEYYPHRAFFAFS